MLFWPSGFIKIMLKYVQRERPLINSFQSATKKPLNDGLLKANLSGDSDKNFAS